MNNLIGILMRFCREQIALMCDVERMFHQFRVSPEYLDYLRFIWFDSQGQPAVYRMRVHIFGSKSSPACSTYGLRYLADSSHDVDDPDSVTAAKFIQTDFYVDDSLTSVETADEASKLITNREICMSGNICLHKFMSISSEVMEQDSSQ